MYIFHASSNTLSGGEYEHSNLKHALANIQYKFLLACTGGNGVSGPKPVFLHIAAIYALVSFYDGGA